ncbi:HD domain-containing protein [Janthinobacterium aquaticum]|uniref:HD domain-containing protein n=1 Tax=Janthinobacterium sp. FT58W TaxID=2654254 RepID=UPI001264139E|nr:HD domain-containing protein [Janthinobacterium sp. FT58W]KAB8038472.1 HD domain-containing protein [Janthinobacterium sp. FT58W]
MPYPTTPATLERAIEIAARTHAGQVDKGGAPYILHPLRVMLRVAPGVQQIVAVLHDVVEDSDGRVTFEDLACEGFAAEVIEALRAVSKVKGESYADFVARAARNPTGKAVKLADLLENSDLSRIAQPSQKDLERLEKYRAAIAYLQAN